MDEEGETRAAPGHGPFQHLQVAVRVTKSGNRASANVALYPDWLAFLVVDKIDLRQTDKHRFAVTQFKFCFDAAADDLLRWDAVSLLHPWAHELDAAAGDDEGLEA